MATSLEDETQQPSFYGQPSSPSGPSGSSPPPLTSLRRRGTRASSPIADSSFLNQQLDTSRHGAEQESAESLRESALARGAQAVNSGNLLRVAPPPSEKRPVWSTQPPATSQLTDPEDSLGVNQVEEDELESSSPMPPRSSPRKPEEAGSIPSPPNSSPPPAIRASSRKRKEPPMASSPRTTPSKAIGQKPISAHSPARLNLAAKPTSDRLTRNKPLPTPPVSARPVSSARTFVRTSSRAKKQKVAEEEPDSFAGADVRYPVKQAASVFLPRLMSDDAGWEIPKEMRTLSGEMADAEMEDEEEGIGVRAVAKGGAEDDEMEDRVEKLGEVEEDEVDKSVGQIRDSGNDGPAADVDVVVGAHIASSSSGARVLIPASSSASEKANTTAESVLFPDSHPQPALPIADTQPSAHSLPPSSAPPTHPSQPHPISQPSQAAPLHEEQSLFTRPRRGFTNVMSETQDDSPNSANARVDRRELFSSQGDGLGSSQGMGSQSLGWLNFQPTQVRASLPVDNEGDEPTQIVSDESHQRAQDVLVERRRREREEEEEDRRRDAEVDAEMGGGGYTQMSTQEGGTQERQSVPRQGEEGTQQVSEESLERGQELWRARMEADAKERREHQEAADAHLEESTPAEESVRSQPATLEATYQTRTSQEEAVPPAPAEPYQRAIEQVVPARSASAGRGSEPPVNPRVAPNRQLRRRNMQETQSAPQPLLGVPSLAPITSGRSRTDPVPESTSRLATPPQPLARSGLSRHASRQRSPEAHIQIDIDMGSPALQGPSSSMQEADDMLQLGVITQITAEAQSQSPPVRASARRSARPRVQHTASSSPSPKSPRPAREASPVQFSQSLPQPPSRSGPGPPVQEYKATFLNETEQTLPPPAKVPSPLRTYGTRNGGTNGSPSKMPTPPGARPVVEISPLRPTLKGRRRGADDVQRASATTPTSARKRKRGGRNEGAGSDEERGTSPDPLDSIHGAERMEVDDQSEPESPPTPQDTTDYSYRPVLPLRTSTSSATAKAGKKAPTPAAPPTRAKKATPVKPKGKTKTDRKVFSATTKFPSATISRNTSSTELSSVGGPAKKPKAAVKNAKGLKSARASTSTALTAAPSDSELSEPESPPTPQDPEDETFKVSKKATASVGRKKVSRQVSNASTTNSAGAGKGKAAAKKRGKGRHSNLSKGTEDVELPTPTYTSQRSMTEEEDDEEDDGVEDGPLAFALYPINKCYYACRVVARMGDAYRVRYLDNDTAIVGLDEIRRYELKEGDKVKFHIPRLKKKPDLEIGADWADGDGTVLVRGKAKAVEGRFEVHLVRFTSQHVQQRFEDRRVTADMFEELPEEEADEEDEAAIADIATRAAGADPAKRTASTADVKPKVDTTIFQGKIFMVTPTDSSTSAIAQAIERNGGTLCDWPQLFAAKEFGQPLKSGEGTPFLITPDIASGKAGMKVKSMVALSFGIPCLSPEYVEAALADPDCDWLPYAICTGTSRFTKSPGLQFIDEAWGKPGWDIRAARNRRRPLANMRVLSMDLSSKHLDEIIATCVFGLGAISCNKTTATALPNISEDTYDLLIVSSQETKGPKIDLPKIVRRNEKAGDVQWLKQVMVSGARLPMKLYSYEKSA